MSRGIRALFVDDSEQDVRLLLRALESYGFTVDHRRVDSLAALADAVERENWDVVLIDYTLPRFSGIDALSAIRASNRVPGMVIVSGTISEEMAVQTLSAGAHDYVLKDNLKRLGPAVDHAIREASHRVRQEWAETELRKSEEKYRQLHQSMRDAFMLVDMGGRILETNKVFQELVGYEAEELTALDCRVLIKEERREREEEVLSTQVLSRGYSDVYEQEYRHKNGTILIEALDGEDALAKYKVNRDAISLLILDVVMPKRSGKSVADEIMGLKPGIRILFVSGYTADIIHEKGILDEGLNFISKPFPPRALLKKVREILDL